MQGLAAHCRFGLAGALPTTPAHADAAQLEQALINLLKSAHESGSAGEMVTLNIDVSSDTLRLCVADRSPGMSPARLKTDVVRSKLMLGQLRKECCV